MSACSQIQGIRYMAIHPLSLMSAPPAGPLPDCPPPPLLRLSLALYCVALRLALGHTCCAVGLGAVADGYACMILSKYAERGRREEDCCGLLIYSRLGIIPLFFFFFVPEFQSVGVLNSALVYIQFLFFPQHIFKTPQSNEEAARSTHPSAYQQWCQGEP